jgi:hypothetical protein
VESVIILCGRVGQLLGFERNRTEHSETRMPSLSIVPAFYPFEDDLGKLVPYFPGSGVKHFELQGSQKDSIIGRVGGGDLTRRRSQNLG